VVDYTGKAIDDMVLYFSILLEVSSFAKGKL
jgi:hypothetical protein